MSLKEVNRAFDRKEIQVKDKFKLVLSKRFLDTVDYLHQEIGNIEWSGILITKVLEGSIEDVSKLKIYVEDILLMDIGTSGYTEYEFKATDSYLMEGMSSAFENNKKMGHVHSHLNWCS